MQESRSKYDSDRKKGNEEDEDDVRRKEERRKRREKEKRRRERREDEREVNFQTPNYTQNNSTLKNTPKLLSRDLE